MFSIVTNLLYKTSWFQSFPFITKILLKIWWEVLTENSRAWSVGAFWSEYRLSTPQSPVLSRGGQIAVWDRPKNFGLAKILTKTQIYSVALSVQNAGHCIFSIIRKSWFMINIVFLILFNLLYFNVWSILTDDKFTR